jgi:hypothetical protein
MKKIAIFLVLLITTSASAQYMKPMLGRQINHAHGLSDFVGCWLMNEGAGDKVYDLSGNGKDGTLTNGPTWDVGSFGPGVLGRGKFRAGRESEWF